MTAMGSPEVLFFALKWQLMVEKDHFGNKLCAMPQEPRATAAYM